MLISSSRIEGPNISSCISSRKTVSWLPCALRTESLDMGFMESPQPIAHLREGGLTPLHSGAPPSEFCLSSSLLLARKAVARHQA
ncbi:unnamed protein product [Lota lota]